jgi:hypothetical protein
LMRLFWRDSALSLLHISFIVRTLETGRRTVQLRNVVMPMYVL